MSGQARPLCVALTGGIASGKTAVSDEFSRLGAGVVDTDVIAREVVAVGSPGLAEIVTHFGADMVDEHGALRRRLLRERVFAHDADRRALERITHPRIRAIAAERVAAAQSPYVILVIPLLSAATRYQFIDRVLVVDVSVQTQLDRLTARDGVTLGLAQSMLDAQLSRDQRLALADDVLSNEADLLTLHAGVAQLDARYRELAKSGSGPSAE